MSVSRVSAALSRHAAAFSALLVAVALAVGASAAGAQSEGAGSGGPWIAPERASRQTNPSTSSAASIKRGNSIFQRECEKCHGKAGHGDGPQAAFLDSKPMDLASEQVRSQSDGALFYKITEGRGQMPKAKINDSEKWAVIEYIRTLSPSKVNIARSPR